MITIVSFLLNNFIDLTLAVIIDWIIGDPYWFPHPVIYIGKLISYLEKKGRKYIENGKGLKVFGGFIVMIVATISFLIPYSLLYLTKGNQWIYHVLNVFILWTTLSAKCLKNEAIKVYHALKNEDIEDARLKLSYIVGRDTKSLMEDEIIRADIETVAENTADGVIAPLLYGLVGGAPLAMMYKGINTMDSMLGYMDERFINIGFFPAKVDDVFNYIPARFSGILIGLSSPVVGGNIIESFKVMIRDRKNHKSPNCAYPEGAAAGAMGIQVGGTNTYFGKVVYKPTIGDKKVDLNYNHIFGSIKLMFASEVLFLIAFGIVILTLNIKGV